MGWRLIKSAPGDGTVITIRTKRGRILRASWQGGLVDDQDNSCGGWFAEDVDTQPPCWSDGICWSENADGNESDQPVKWMSI